MLLNPGCLKPSRCENYSHVRNVVADIGSLGTVVDVGLSQPIFCQRVT